MPRICDSYTVPRNRSRPLKTLGFDFNGFLSHLCHLHCPRPDLVIKKTAAFVQVDSGVLKPSSITQRAAFTFFSGDLQRHTYETQAPEDGGDCVQDAGSGKIVTAAKPVWLLALDFFKDVRRAANSSLKPPTASLRGSRICRLERKTDWWEPQPSCCFCPLSRQIGELGGHVCGVGLSRGQ